MDAYKKEQTSPACASVSQLPDPSWEEQHKGHQVIWQTYDHDVHDEWVCITCNSFQSDSYRHG